MGTRYSPKPIIRVTHREMARDEIPLHCEIGHLVHHEGTKNTKDSTKMRNFLGDNLVFFVPWW
jgi:hypothetical protein